MDQTIDYYNLNAENFIENTQNVDMHLAQDKFLHLLNEGAAILDFGCGSGRDTKYFLDKGCQVTATDGSAELCRRASSFTGIEVQEMLFQELDEIETYDGIWACSSILHLPK
ncbi:MAG: class I SAM-dependent methyltransferase, partial [Erysipelotrichaceae bacterium]|nr:class I SAM-dependent methyltransferase [Erysipelotrichaceae bacterium]